MRPCRVLLKAATLLLGSQLALAASSWTFSDASLTVQGKGAGVGTGLKEKCVITLHQQLAISLLTMNKALSE